MHTDSDTRLAIVPLSARATYAICLSKASFPSPACTKCPTKWIFHGCTLVAQYVTWVTKMLRWSLPCKWGVPDQTCWNLAENTNSIPKLAFKKYVLGCLLRRCTKLSKYFMVVRLWEETLPGLPKCYSRACHSNSAFQLC